MYLGLRCDDGACAVWKYPSVSQVNAARAAKEDSTGSQRSRSEEPWKVEGPGMKWVLGVSEWPPRIG